MARGVSWFLGMYACGSKSSNSLRGLTILGLSKIAGSWKDYRICIWLLVRFPEAGLDMTVTHRKLLRFSFAEPSLNESLSLGISSADICFVRLSCEGSG